MKKFIIPNYEVVSISTETIRTSGGGGGGCGFVCDKCREVCTGANTCELAECTSVNA